LLLISLVAASCFAARAPAQTFSPYSDFQAMTLSQLATLQVKLTYVGDYSNATLSSVLLGASANNLDHTLFVPYRRADQTYDDAGFLKFTATVQELKALIDDVGTLPGVTDGDVDPNGSVSFSMLNTSGGTKVFEAIVDSANGETLFRQILAALSNNAPGTRTIRMFACGVWMLPRTPPANIQNQIQLVKSGLRADRRAPTQYVGKVKITNTSGSTIPAPIILVVRGGDLVGSDGETCNIRPPGASFLTLLSSGGLAPGASIEKTIRIANASDGKAGSALDVYAGAGTP